MLGLLCWLDFLNKRLLLGKINKKFMDGGSNSLTCFRPVHILNRMMLLNTHWELV